MTGPLAGVKVLDLTRMFAGPYCTQILADLGAQVLKVEDPRTGDPTRRNLPMKNSESAYFMALNRGKRSLTMDLKSAADQELLRSLISEATVVVENFRPGVTRRLGIAPASAAELNPRLVYCSLSGFGATGPYRDHISFDLINQAMAGFIDLTGNPDGSPVRVGVPIGDMAGGLYTAMAAISGLIHVQRTGSGIWFDLALHDVLVAMLDDVVLDYSAGGAAPVRRGRFGGRGQAIGCFQARDGWVAVDVSRPGEPTRALTVLGQSVATEADPADIGAALDGAVAEWTVADIVERLTKDGIACSKVNAIDEVLAEAVTRAPGMRFGALHPAAGDIENLASPFILDGRRAGTGTVSPLLGEANDEVRARRTFPVFEEVASKAEKATT